MTATTTATEARAGIGTLQPYLSVRDAARAIEFYADVFGAVETGARYTDADGRIGHAEITIGDAVIMLSDEYPDYLALSPETVGGTPVALHLYVADVDAVFARAIASGSTAEREPADQDYGDRAGNFRDPFGHRWFVATRAEEVSIDELQRRGAASGFAVEQPTPSEPDVPKLVWPTLLYVDAPGAIRLLVDVFGFEERLVVPGETEDVIAHAELQWPEGGGVMLGTAGRGDSEYSQRPTGTGSVYVVTDRPDDLYERARSAGLAIVQDIYDADYGSRGFTVSDSEGNLWSFGTYRGVLT